MGASDPATDAVAELAERFVQGDKRALARAISWTEDLDPRAEALARALRGQPEDAWVVGITGAPGVGKSSLVNRLAHRYLEADRSVAVLAVDPTSPFSGGAVLGDRIRMNLAVTHPKAFVRSTGTRGALGGLARTTPAVIRLMARFGFDIVLVETVGVGQSEVEVVGAADTSVVVEAPGLGDSVQAIKAGILEIGDVFVVNKADRPGANRAALEIETMLALGGEAREWDPPVTMTSSTKDDGFGELVDALGRHRSFLEDSGRIADVRRRRRTGHFWQAVTARLKDQLAAHLEGMTEGSPLDDVGAGVLGPEEAAARVLARFEIQE